MFFTTQNFELYKSLIKGRNNIYAVRWERNGKSGYMPAYDLEWSDYEKHKLLGGTLFQYIGRIQGSEKPLFQEKIWYDRKRLFHSNRCKSSDKDAMEALQERESTSLLAKKKALLASCNDFVT